MTISEVDETLDPLVIEAPKVRQCLRCDEDFTSTWSGERVCKKCKSSAAWRESQA